MNVLIAGIDGYLGWPLALHLKSRGHRVAGLDNLSRRYNVGEHVDGIFGETKLDSGGNSVIPIPTIYDRVEILASLGIEFLRHDLAKLDGEERLVDLLTRFKPDAIIHLAEQPSAPFSMTKNNCLWTMQNNIMGSMRLLWLMREHCPEAHLVKLGTMGEYGTPNIDITEGRIEVEFRGRKDLLPFPRQPGSWYHLTKVHDTWNVEFACKVWGLRSTDIMQGVVYGTRTDEMGKDEALRTRFDCDEAFGTAINRFCAQAVVGIPLTVYGAGGQTRGYLGIRDSIQCFTIAIEHPPAEGEYRVFNQFDDSYSVNKLAEAVQAAGERLGMDVTIESIENPRVEMEEHHYHPDHTKLAELGFRPVTRLHTELEMMLCDLKQHRDRIEKIRDHIMPKTFWKKS